MNKSLIIFCCLAAFGTSAICNAAPFQNLNFDGANTNNLRDVSGRGDYDGPTFELLPDWRLTVSGQTEIRTLFNTTAAGSGFNTIVSPSFSGRFPVIGLYSFAMVPRQDVLGTFVPYSLSQSGDVPADARSIHFFSYGAPVQLEVNNSLSPLIYTRALFQPGWNGNIPVFDVVGDISPYAGQTVELKFTTLLTPGFPGNGLDEIFFSDIAIPEPSTLALWFLGAAIFGTALRRR